MMKPGPGYKLQGSGISGGQHIAPQYGQPAPEQALQQHMASKPVQGPPMGVQHGPSQPGQYVMMEGQSAPMVMGQGYNPAMRMSQNQMQMMGQMGPLPGLQGPQQHGGSYYAPPQMQGAPAYYPVSQVSQQAPPQQQGQSVQPQGQAGPQGGAQKLGFAHSAAGSQQIVLNEDQCRILSKIQRNGLQVFEYFHDFGIHADDMNPRCKKVNLSTFMSIYAQIFHPINFKDIIEPNMELIFKYLLKYAKYCSDNCLQNLIIEPFCNLSQYPDAGQARGGGQFPPGGAPSVAQVQHYNKNIVEILTHYLLLKLEPSYENLDQMHPFYEYKEDYFCLLQKLIRFPFRCISKFFDDSFIKNYFRQIVLFFIKKAHTSQYGLEYLQLLRTLFKNLLYNATSKFSDSQLFTDFHSICTKEKVSGAERNEKSDRNQFCNVNIIENLMAFYETGIPEMKEIVTELIIMLPLKSKYLIQLAKSKIIAKPFINSLLLSDGSFTMRMLKTLEIIVLNLSFEEIQYFLQDVKEDLLEKLYDILKSADVNDFHPPSLQKQPNNDSVVFTLKLLGKLGQIPRLYKKKLNIEEKFNDEDLQFVFNFYAHQKHPFDDRERLYKQKPLKVSFYEAVNYSVTILRKLLDNHYAAFFANGVTVEVAYSMLKLVILQYFQFPCAALDATLIWDIQSYRFKNVNQKARAQAQQKYLPAQSSDTKWKFLMKEYNLKNELIYRVLTTYMELFSLNMKLNIAPPLMQRIKEDAENVLKTLGQMVAYAYIDELNDEAAPLASQSQSQDLEQIDDQKSKFLVCLIATLKQKVIIIREDLINQKDVVVQPAQFLFGVLCEMLELIKKNVSYTAAKPRLRYIQFHNYLMQLFIDECGRKSTEFNNRHSLLDCISQLLDVIPQETFVEKIVKIFEIIFIVMNDLPDVIVVSTTKLCNNLCQKVMQQIDKISDRISQPTFRSIILIFAHNLVVYKASTHELAKKGLQQLAAVKKINMISLLYMHRTRPEEDVHFDEDFLRHLKDGAKYQFLEECIHPENFKCVPTKFSINSLLKNHHHLFISVILREAMCGLDIQNTELQANDKIEKKLQLLNNCFKTIEFILLAEPCPPFQILEAGGGEVDPRAQPPGDAEGAQTHAQPHAPGQSGMQIEGQLRDALFRIEKELYKSLIKQGLQILDTNEAIFKLQSKVILPCQMLPGVVPQPVQMGPGKQGQLVSSMQTSALMGNAQPAQPHQPGPGQAYAPRQGYLGQGQQQQQLGGPAPHMMKSSIYPSQDPHDKMELEEGEEGACKQPTLNASTIQGRKQTQNGMVGGGMMPGMGAPYGMNPVQQSQQAGNCPPQGQSGVNAGLASQMQSSSAAQGQPGPQGPGQGSSHQVPGQGAPSSSQQQQQQGAGQNGFKINDQLFFNDQEYNLNIEDIDMNVACWSQLLSSIMSFLKSILSLPAIYTLWKRCLKIRDRNVQEGCEIMKTRYQIIFKLFDMMMRVERTIRNTASSCLRDLLKMENHPKELLFNDEKLKIILRPVLICLQHEFKSFSPAFLLVLKQILKLLTQCFNKALSDKLLAHLGEINQKFLQEQRSYNENITLCKCISGLLSLFEYLSYAYQTASQPYPRQSLEKIMRSIILIENELAPKIGRYTICQLTRKPLMKFINIMSSHVIEFFYTNDTEYIKLLLEILKYDQAHPLRERISRDSAANLLFAARLLDETRAQQQQTPG